MKFTLDEPKEQKKKELDDWEKERLEEYEFLKNLNLSKGYKNFAKR